jgi:KUP system potassium uptake protein
MFERSDPPSDPVLGRPDDNSLAPDEVGSQTELLEGESVDSSGSGASGLRSPLRPKAAAGSLPALSLAALGVVFGDIGTSPLYAIRECFRPEHGVHPTAANVLGVLSLVSWALLLVISVKYLAYVMRADDNGEGGILALMALASSPRGLTRSGLIAGLGLLGAGLLFGDGIITPAISVLSAVEGLHIATPKLSRWVVPLTVTVLVLLFAAERHGTTKVGTAFGPVLTLWFLVLAALGIESILETPQVLRAVNPLYAVAFLRSNGAGAFLTLGAVFLAVTGGEALYADMGHFGPKPIRVTWYGLVLPSLLLNYFGQGAMLLRDASALENPFYRLAPAWGMVPLVLLSTAATIIASQAVISGVFSLTRQASMLGYWPRVRIAHTSPDRAGQIYVPSVNWAMMVGTVFVVLGFEKSTALGAAYGIAVSGTMVVTTALAAVVTHRRWRWPLALTVGVTLAFGAVDCAFLSANATKIVHGGWLPLLVAVSIWLLTTSYWRGRQLLGRRFQEYMVPLPDFWELIRVERPARVPGTAVFMTSNTRGTPLALLNNFMHNHVIHKNVVLLTVQTLPMARTPPERRLSIEKLDHGFVRITARFGFMEHPDVPFLLEHAELPDFFSEHATYFIGREAVVHESQSIWAWRLWLFAALSRNASNPTDYFNIPPDRMIEIGARVQL